MKTTNCPECGRVVCPDCGRPVGEGTVGAIANRMPGNVTPWDAHIWGTGEVPVQTRFARMLSGYIKKDRYDLTLVPWVERLFPLHWATASAMLAEYNAYAKTRRPPAPQYRTALDVHQTCKELWEWVRQRITTVSFF